MLSFSINTAMVELDYHYSIPLVVLSILVVVVGTLTALISNIRIRENSFVGRNIWILIATTALSTSIWSMHFIGMQAIILPEKASYNYFYTALSCIPVYIGILIAFYILNNVKKDWKIYYLTSNVVGLSVISMHYIGMKAMYFETIHHVYNPYWFVLSIIVALVGSFGAFYVFSNTRLYRLNSKKRFIPAVILGLSFALFHYVGMYSVQYYRVASPMQHEGGLADNLLQGALLDTIIVWNAFLVVLLFLYVTYSNQYFEKRLTYFDTLTKLPNTRLFYRRLEEQQKVYAMAVVQLNGLDEFKQYYGYLFVDELLRHIAAIFKDYSSALISVYRIDNHRFVFMATENKASADLERDLFKISNLLRQSFVFENQHITLKGKCALVLNKHLEDAKNIYYDALSVINHPSIDQQFTVTYFEMDYHERNFDEEIIDNFPKSMKDGSLYVVYQPKIDGSSKQSHSAEALVRWQHPRHGLLSPAVFLPILEANDLMGVLTDWVIEQVCRNLHDWKSFLMMPQQVAINIPGPYLTSIQLMRQLKEMTNRYGISPAAIELEITETHYVKTITSAEKAVRAYRSEGFSVALDDFGTGVSSLSYLKKIPITTLKIDKSFIDGVPISEKDASILKSIIQLGHSLNLTVVVEGIESVEQVQFLQKYCNAPQMQGFYFAQPMREEELIKWCRTFSAPVYVN